MGNVQQGVRHLKTVGGQISKYVPHEALVFHNFRLDDHGIAGTKRLLVDNKRTILSGFGMNWGRALGYVKEITDGKGHTKTMIQTESLEAAASTACAQLIDISQYKPAIRELYGDQQMSVRSNFISKIYWEGIGGYGVNKDFTIKWNIEKAAISYLNENYFEYFSSEVFNFDWLQFVESGRWLTHIRTGVNSGYPYNSQQVKNKKTKKDQVSAWEKRKDYIKLMQKYLRGDRIDWKKLVFQMGMRTERNDSQRVIMQAPFVDKISASIVNTVLDDHKLDLPLSIPRKYGSFNNLAQKIIQTPGNIFCKDFKKFDRHVPIHLVKIIRKWFASIDNTFCKLMCFELDLLINSILILQAGIGFKVNSIPSGIGITQFIGSLIHEIIDYTSGLDAEFTVYQSDDTLCVTNMDEKECSKFMEDVTFNFKMPISPIGEKSLYSDSVGILLQKIIDKEDKVFYNHEPRAFNNGIFRERYYNVGEEFKIFIGEKDTKKAAKKNAVLSYLGNLQSYGPNAPSLPYIWSFMYGKKSGFTKSQVQWALKNFERYDKFVKNREQHRPLEPTGWFMQTMERLVDKSWGSCQPNDVIRAVEGALV